MNGLPSYPGDLPPEPSEWPVRRHLSPSERVQSWQRAPLMPAAAYAFAALGLLAVAAVVLASLRG